MRQGGDGFQDDGGQRLRRLLRRTAGRLVRPQQPRNRLRLALQILERRHGTRLLSGRLSGQRHDGCHAGAGRCFRHGRRLSDRRVARVRLRPRESLPQPGPALLQRDFLQRPFGGYGADEQDLHFRELVQRRQGCGRNQFEELADELPHQKVRLHGPQLVRDLGQQDAAFEILHPLGPHGAGLRRGGQPRRRSQRPDRRPDGPRGYRLVAQPHDLRRCRGHQVGPLSGAGVAGRQGGFRQVPAQRAPHRVGFRGSPFLR